MLRVELNSERVLQELLAQQSGLVSISAQSLEERVRLLILRDLLRLGWDMSLRGSAILITPPTRYDRTVVQASMEMKRREAIEQSSHWITKHLHLAHRNLADGDQVLQSQIEPVVEVCEKQNQFDLFRLLRYYWSSPYSEYVGRRIKLLVRDAALPSRPIIGIAALGSSIVHIPARDSWVGWDRPTRTLNLVYTMDAYVLGALPPYSYLLGGKLMSLIVASNEVRHIYERKYQGQVTNISKRTANDLACVFTTGLYGKSSQYNRIKYEDRLMYIPIGKTKGFGTLHLTNETVEAMRDLLRTRGILVGNRFGDGPVWRMRVIRSAADILGLDANLLLRHSFPRGIYAVPLAHNTREFLRGEHNTLDYYDHPLRDLIRHWRERWLLPRRRSPTIAATISSFRARTFSIV